MADSKDTKAESKAVETKAVVAATDAQTKTEQAMATRAANEAEARAEDSADTVLAEKAASGDETAQATVYSTALAKPVDEDAKVPKEDKSAIVRQARTDGTPKTGITG